MNVILTAKEFKLKNLFDLGYSRWRIETYQSMQCAFPTPVVQADEYSAGHAALAVSCYSVYI